MLNFMELTLADGREIDIPIGTAVMVEEMTETTNPNFPAARAHFTYGLGEKVNTALLSTKLSDLILELGINTAPSGTWLQLTRKDTGLALIVLVKNVVGRMALDEGCQISVVVGENVQIYEVNESRRQIKKWSQMEVGRPEGLIELPVPVENR